MCSIEKSLSHLVVLVTVMFIIRLSRHIITPAPPPRYAPRYKAMDSQGLLWLIVARYCFCCNRSRYINFWAHHLLFLSAGKNNILNGNFAKEEAEEEVFSP